MTAQQTGGSTRLFIGTPDTQAISAAPTPPFPSSAIRAAARISPILYVFILSTFIPMTFSLGGLSLSPARVVLVLLTIPVLLMFAFGRAGRVMLSDIFAFFYVLWLSVAIFAFGGISQIEFIGISTIEVITPYLLGRCLIRSRAQYNTFLRFMLVLISFVALLAAVESTTGRLLVNQILDIFGDTYSSIPERYERRLGFIRAQTVFEHPILYGVVMSMFFAPFYFMRSFQSWPGKRSRASLAALATFFSLSAGAWLGLMAQIGLMLWDKIFFNWKARWKVLIALAVLGYVMVDLLSNRTPFEVFISRFAMNAHNAYWRVLIFIYGMENVWANPILGIGLGGWTRPEWMQTASVDNFWLLTAMRYGIPAFVCLAGMYLSITIGLARLRIIDEGLRLQRNALVYTLVGLSLSLATVHLWGTALYMVFFLLGSMSWVHVGNDDPSQPEERSQAPFARRLARAA